jgi:hypothetical protein
MVELIPCEVRDGFWVHLEGGGVHPPGTRLKLSPRQYLTHAHQVQLIEEEDKPNVASNTRKSHARPASPGSEDGSANPKP